MPTGSADGPYCEWTDLLAVSRLERQELRRQRGLARALAWHDKVLELLKAELLPDARERAQQLPDLALRDPQQPVGASPGAAVGSPDERRGKGKARLNALAISSMSSVPPQSASISLKTARNRSSVKTSPVAQAPMTCVGRMLYDRRRSHVV